MGMLNPSTANHADDDPTIRQCRARMRQARHGALLVWNLFAWRATLPAELKAAQDPFGPHNDAAIALALSLCSSTILAWGNHGRFRERDVEVHAICAPFRASFSVLGLTSQGLPRHPLYVPLHQRLRRWTLPRLPDPSTR